MVVVVGRTPLTANAIGVDALDVSVVVPTKMALYNLLPILGMNRSVAVPLLVS